MYSNDFLKNVIQFNSIRGRITKQPFEINSFNSYVEFLFRSFLKTSIIFFLLRLGKLYLHNVV